MSKQTRLTGYRNAMHYGYIKSKNPEGIGFILDDLFLMALSNWKQYRMNGHTVVVYPNRQILYTIFENDTPKGLWSFIPNKYSQIFGAGVDANHTQKLALYPQQSNSVIELEIDQRVLSIKKEHGFSSEDQKWKIISDILSIRIDPSYYTLHSFIQKHFIEATNNQLTCKRNKFHNIYRFETEQTLGFCVGSRGEVEEVGEYNSENLVFGRKYTQTGKNDEVNIEEGIFQGEKNLVRYTDVRGNGRKITQDYFRQSTNFMNKFIYMVAADDFYQYIKPKVSAYSESLSSSFGQKIIEADQIPTQSNKQYNLEEAKKAIYGQISKKNSSKRSGGYDTSRRQRSPGTERRKYAYNDDENQIKVAEFRINEQMLMEEKRRKIEMEEQIRVKKKIQEEEQRMLMAQIEKENEMRRKIEEENEMRRKLRQLEMEKQKLDRIKVAETYKEDKRHYAEGPYLSTFGQGYIQSEKVMRERQKNRVYPKKYINYLNEPTVRVESRSRSRTPIKGINSTARTSRMSPHKPSRKNYKYID